MIIQCEKCRTRFRLDDSKISAAGVRVRCSRCSHTFVVRRDAPEEEQDFDSILLGLGDAPSDGQKEATEGSIDSAASPDHGLYGEEPPAAPEPEEAESQVGEWEPEPDDDSETPQSVEPPEEAFSDVFGTGEGMPDFQLQGDAAEEAAEQAAEADEVAALEESPAMEEPAALEESNAMEESAATEEPAVTEEAAETEPESDVRPFADEPESWDVVPGIDSEAVPPPEVEESVRQSLERVKSDSAQSYADEKVMWPVADGGDGEPEEDELPPLSIASRRKGLRLLPVLLGTLLVLALGAAGYFLMQGGAGSLAGMLPYGLRQLLGGGEKAQAAAIRSLEGEFISNSEAGELFVMRGEVFNSSEKPIASIQVKGTVYGANGETLAQRTVFCGNTLSREQLALQPYSSMEKVMGSRFGDTLANLEVLPGKAVPFLVVFRDVPKGATDFGAVVFEAAVR